MAASQPSTLEDARCRTCGYALRALAEPRCPECGTAFDPADARTWWQPSLLSRLAAIPGQSASRVARFVVAAFFASWTWSELWLPGGYLVVVVAALIAVIVIAVEWLGVILSTVLEFRSRIAPNRGPGKKSPWVIVAALALLASNLFGIGPRVTLLASRWHVEPILWDEWAVKPLGVGRSGAMPAPFYASYHVHPNGVFVDVYGAGSLRFADDGDGSPTWEVTRTRWFWGDYIYLRR